MRRDITEKPQRDDRDTAAFGIGRNGSRHSDDAMPQISYLDNEMYVKKTARTSL